VAAVSGEAAALQEFLEILWLQAEVAVAALAEMAVAAVLLVEMAERRLGSFLRASFASGVLAAVAETR
jgi:hypothetical protein